MSSKRAEPACLRPPSVAAAVPFAQSVWCREANPGTATVSVRSGPTCSYTDSSRFCCLAAKQYRTYGRSVFLP